MKKVIRTIPPVNYDDSSIQRDRVNKYRQSLSKRLSCILPTVESETISRQHLEELEVKARNVVNKSRLLNDPVTTFTIANLMKEQRIKAPILQSTQSYNQSPKKDLFLPILGHKKQGMNQRRQEVYDLAKWLDSKLDSFRKKEKLQLDDILQYKQGVINLALGQLIRMVGSTCREQAKLLQLIWDSTFEIFEKLIATLATLTQTKEKQFSKELLNQSITFENKIIEIDQGKIELKKQKDFILDKFKQLILNNRQLKRDYKQLQLKNRMTEYSLQSYQQSYVVVLEMALQSTDSNILDWARKIMSKLLRDKRRKRKNFIKSKVDKDIFRSSKEVVCSWLSRNVEQYKPEDFDQYDQANVEQRFSVQRKSMAKFEPKLSKYGFQKVNLNKEQSFLNTISVKENQELLNEIYKNKDQMSQSSEQSNKEDLYAYFRCYDIGTSMDITYCEAGVNHVPSHKNVCLQTDVLRVVDCAISAYEGSSSDEQSNVAKHRKGVLMNQFDVAISDTERTISDAGTKSKSKYKWNKSRVKKQHSEEDNNLKYKKLDKKISNSKKNYVRIGHYYDERGREIRRTIKRTKSSQIGRLVNAKSNTEVVTRGLQLRKFSEIFDSEKMRMFKNLKEYVQNIERRRSFYRIKEVEYITQGGGQLHAIQKKIVMNTKYRAVGLVNNFSKISKKIRQMLEQNINVMRFRTYKLNQQIFNSIANDLKPIRIRDQKVLATYNSLCKVFSALIIDYVKIAKKDKQQGKNYKVEKFFYPLNILYVDRFLHIFGLKEIAERNIRNTIIQIISLADKLERIRLFRQLLGIGDSNISGDQLQIYIKCLVYFDNTGKVSMNQASMKDFNIDKLSTDVNTVLENLPLVCEQLLCPNQIPRIVAQIQKFSDQDITIEGIALMLIKANCQFRNKMSHEYLPLYQYLVGQGDVICNFLSITKMCRIGVNSQIETVKVLASNLDVLDDNGRTITPQRFLSSCLKLNFPTITQMSQFFWNQISKYNYNQTLKQHFVESDKFDTTRFSEIGKQWCILIPQTLLAQVTSSIENCVLFKFWRGMAIHLLLSTQLQNTIDRIIPELLTINSQTYSIFFRRQK